MRDKWQHFSADEDRIIGKMWRDGESDEAIGASVGRSAKSIKHRRALLHLTGPERRQHDWSKVDWSLPSAVIAEQLGTTVNAVKGRRLKMGIRIGRKRAAEPPTGERRTVILTDADWSAAKAAAKSRKQTVHEYIAALIRGQR